MATRNKEVGLRVRIEPELRDQFIAKCRMKDTTASQMIRAFMRKYVEDGGAVEQLGLFDPPTEVEDMLQKNSVGNRKKAFR